MPTRVVRVMPWCLTLVAVVAVTVATAPAEARTPAPDTEDSCYACHESLYRLHDIGKAFCLCGAPMNCTCCHGGVAGAQDAEAAHVGMVAKPLAQEAPPCQSCHPDDYQSREAIFTTRAGVSATPCPTMQAMITARLASAAPAEPSGLEAWQIALLSLLVLAFLALAFFAYRCWKADCLSRSARQ
jgi:hypothetical protein